MKKWIWMLLIFPLFFQCHSGSTLYDSDGMLKINGRRVFILGSYHLPHETHPFKKLAQMGFNLVHVAADSAQLRLAQKAGLNAWISLGGWDTNHPQNSRNRLRKVVTSFQKAPALLFWESVDEPAWTWKKATPRVPPEPLIQEYRFVKSLDPTHLFYLNHAPENLISTLRRYNSATDIVACDIYPVIPHGIREQYALNPDGRQGDLLNCFVSQVGAFTRKMRRVAGPNRPVFMVLQGFAWEMLRKPQDRDTTKILFPTLKQTRFMAFDAIVNGANGLLYWGTAYTPQTNPFWNSLAQVTHELKDLAPVLSAKEVPQNSPPIYHEMGHSVDKGVVFKVKSAPTGIFLLAANEDPNPVKITWTRFKKFHKATVVGEGRTLPVDQCHLTDVFEPFDVHVYKLE